MPAGRLSEKSGKMFGLLGCIRRQRWGKGELLQQFTYFFILALECLFGRHRCELEGEFEELRGYLGHRYRALSAAVLQTSRIKLQGFLRGRAELRHELRVAGKGTPLQASGAIAGQAGG